MAFRVLYAVYAKRWSAMSPVTQFSSRAQAAFIRHAAAVLVAAFLMVD
jgi:hypothetical protein